MRFEVYVERPLPDGRLACVFRLTYEATRLAVSGAPPLPEFPHFGVADAWSYGTWDAAVAALFKWDGTGEPVGWVGHDVA